MARTSFVRVLLDLRDLDLIGIVGWAMVFDLGI